ncbi:MAG: DNA polymerase III subunit gamma/tau, partial [Rikenellaceae bacterium]|nr:DNA polymerase III subunit gamma/tau [Rikenellaceae bacterium]
MSEFVVSARKYRPVTFESVVGQKHVTETLRNAVTRGTIAHAYLFCGPRGVGKTTCARILAKTINCMSPKENAEPCNECESCRAFADNRSFNIHELDAASNNSVDNIRALTEQVRIPPQVGRYSIYIIDEAHMLSTAAFNAFLKTLEEPPAHAVFILATTERHKIIPTILSRCQIYDFKRIKADGVVDYLKFISGNESVGYDDEALHIIAQKADGCMRDALSMYDKAVLYCGGNLTGHAVAEALNVLDYDTYFNFVDIVAKGDYASALVHFDQVLQKGFDPQIFLGGLCAHLRNLLVAKNSSTLSLLEVTGSVAERYKRQAAAVSVSFVFDALNVVSAGERDIKNSNSQRLQSEIVILKICNLSPVKLTGGAS